MKEFIKYYLLILTLICLPTASSAQTFNWQSLSQQDAIQVVKVFENNPVLAVNVNPPNTHGFVDTDPAMFDDTDGYSLTTSRYQYTVSKFTHYKFTRTDRLFLAADLTQFYGQTYDPVALSQKAMSRNAVVSIAVSFMQTHFPHPEVLSPGKVVAHYATGNTPGAITSFIDYYSVGFYQTINGVLAPAFCTINVDTVRGQVVSYSQNYYPVLISTLAYLSSNQAMAAAISAFMNMPNTSATELTSPDKVGTLYVTKPDAMGLEILAYDVEFDAAESADNMATTFTATVDADTGNVLSWGELENARPPINAQKSNLFAELCLQEAQNQTDYKPLYSLILIAGKETKLNCAPLLIKKQAYFDAAYLCYGLASAKMVIKTSKQIAIEGQKRQVSFGVNSQIYQVNGQTKRMSAKPVFINGRCYVPLDVMQTVLGGQWSYDKQTQTVRYDPRKPASIKPTKTSGLPMLAAFLLSVSLLTVTAAVCKPHASESSDTR